MSEVKDKKGHKMYRCEGCKVVGCAKVCDFQNITYKRGGLFSLGPKAVCSKCKSMSIIADKME